MLQSVVNRFREYKEPEEGDEESKRSRGHTTSATSKEEEDVILPLGETILSNNLGLPIIVVATKVQFIFHLDVFSKLVVSSMRVIPKKHNRWMSCDILKSPSNHNH